MFDSDSRAGSLRRILRTRKEEAVRALDDQGSCGGGRGILRRGLAALLRDNRYEVREAADGREAVEKYRQWHPTVVLMDVTMPEMDGLAALGAIVAEDGAARVIMCSALAEPEVVAQALRTGAKDFIVKPYERARVLEAVAKWAGALVKPAERRSTEKDDDPC